MSPMLWISIATVAVVASILALPPLPKVRVQYRFAAKLRHRLRRASLHGSPRTFLWTAALTLVVAGAGAAISDYHGSVAPAHSMGSLDIDDGPDNAIVDPLLKYARALGPESQDRAKNQTLLDVDTMIERLASRLKTAPDDLRGWRMLGWSYFNTGAYEKAVLAYERASALDPSSDEIKQSLAAARARVSEISAQ